jgi:prepilin-type N-terminal cleavage/methylation domain-containing protein
MNGTVRQGFTLLELLVAVTVGTLVVLTIRELAGVITGQYERTRDAVIAVDARANGERLVRTLLARARLSDTASSFSGAGDSLRFPTWCDVPMGWLEPCVASIHVATGETRLTLTMVSQTEQLTVPFEAEEILYLVDARNGGRWHRSWTDGLRPPLAIALVRPADTLVLRVGERG